MNMLAKISSLLRSTATNQIEAILVQEISKGVVVGRIPSILKNYLTVTTSLKFERPGDVVGRTTVMR